MRASGVAATFWAERQVRAEGRSKEEADLPATGERERERQTELITLTQYFYDYLMSREQMTNLSFKQTTFHERS